jgi:tetratricopeptide (TPR) repeat protein
MTRRRAPAPANAPAPATGSWRAPALAALLLAAVTTVTFWPIRSHAFLNWDDPEVVAANPRLAQPVSALLPWAFTTREMGHYQPLSWLTLAATAGSPPSAARVHGLAIAAHAANAVLVLLLIGCLLGSQLSPPERWGIALAAAAVFALHPLRVEPVAWASALPYLLSYPLLLGSVGAWIAWLQRGSRAALAVSLLLFAASQLARVTAPLLPLVLAGLALVVPGRRPVAPRQLALALLPFAAIALPLALVEAGARDPAPLSEVGLGARLSWTLIHPALYLWRTLTGVVPSPVEAIPRMPQPQWGLALAALAASAAAVTATARQWSPRTATVVWGAYLALLVPVIGLLPSGLQVTASRYTYGPAIVLSAALAAAVAAAPAAWRRAALAIFVAASVLYASGVRSEAALWRDSLTLWTVAVNRAPDDDVARYNLALALVEAGRSDDAIRQFEALVARVPDHDLGRRQLDRLVADREHRLGDAAANAGRLADAIAAYTRALERDASRARLRLNRGMARVRIGDLAGAAADLDAAGAAQSGDPAVAGALALAWSQTGRAADAVALLRRTAAAHPDDPGLAMNLARLLLTATPVDVRDPMAALQIASRVNDATGGRDPRVLATLAEALAATGQARDAAQAWAVAIEVAAETDPVLAAELRRRRAGR